MSDYYQFRDETGTPIDYYQLVNDNNELCKEIERLNNIINELEKDLKEKIEEDRLNILSNSHWLYILDKLQELKDSDKEWVKK